jgi:hypothetical protein
MLCTATKCVGISNSDIHPDLTGPESLNYRPKTFCNCFFLSLIAAVCSNIPFLTSSAVYCAAAEKRTRKFPSFFLGRPIRPRTILWSREIPTSIGRRAPSQRTAFSKVPVCIEKAAAAGHSARPRFAGGGCDLHPRALTQRCVFSVNSHSCLTTSGPRSINFLLQLFVYLPHVSSLSCTYHSPDAASAGRTALLLASGGAVRASCNHDSLSYFPALGFSTESRKIPEA